MPKTKNAFALRDFDEKRILSRSYFKNLELPTGDDDEILKTFDMSTLDSSSAIEKRIEDLHKLDDKLKNYRRLIKKHRQHLKKLFFKYGSADDDKSKVLYERTAGLLRCYDWFDELAELFNLKFGSLYINGEKILDAQYRRELGGRLKIARQAAGLSQLDIAQKLGLQRVSYLYYEKGERDPSTTTLIRLARLLNVSADKLLGLAS